MKALLMIAVASVLALAAPKAAHAECLEWGELTDKGWQYWPVTIDDVNNTTFHFHWGGVHVNDKGVVIAKLTASVDRSASNDEIVFKGRWSNDATGRYGKIRLFLKKNHHTARGFISFKEEARENKAVLRDCR